MYNKQSYKNELQNIENTLSSFVKESGIEDFAEEANNSLSDRAHYPATVSPELYQALSPIGLLSPGNITNPTSFAKSKSIADRLAYEVYKKELSPQFSHVYRLGDHKYQSGITGLSNLLSGIFSNYLLGKKTTIGLYMTAEPDFLIRKNHERLCELLDGLISAKIVRRSCIEYAIKE